MKRQTESIEEFAKRPKLDTEISAKILDTKSIPDHVWQKIFCSFTLEEIKLKVARVCRHFNIISNDCVQQINICERLFESDYKYKMFDALSNFKFLRTIKIERRIINHYNKEIDYFLMYALKICPRLRFIQALHKLSIGFLDYIAKYGQNLYGLSLNFENNDKPEILYPLKNGMKDLKYLGIFSNLRNFKDEDLLSLVENSTELNSIKFVCDVSYDTILKIINSKKDKLKRLVFIQVVIANELLPNANELLQNAKNCPKLKNLWIAGMDITKSGFEAISKMKNLKFLRLGFPKNTKIKTLKSKSDDLIKMMTNGKLENLKQLTVNGIVDSIDALLMGVALSCPNLQILDCRFHNDNRKDFSKNIIRILVDNLPELKLLHLEWFNEMNDSNPPDIPLFIKSELEEIVGNCENKFQVTINENDKLIKISRISREM